jgi:hypothetical protein
MIKIFMHFLMHKIVTNVIIFKITKSKLTYFLKFVTFAYSYVFLDYLYPTLNDFKENTFNIFIARY